MKFFFLISLLALCACASKPQRKSIYQVEIPAHFPESSYKDIWVQNGCTLFNKKEVKSFPGRMCLFLDDGSFVSAELGTVRRFSPSKSIIWEIDLYAHHQMNLSVDKERILVLASEVVKRGKKQRDDVFLIIDLNGKILARESFYPQFSSNGLKPLLWDELKTLREIDADEETSHFNSIYEIPENSYSSSVPWLKAGNIIVNSLNLGVFVFSPDLKQLLHQKKFPFSQDHMVHDVQITSHGEYLLFNNWTKNPAASRISAIQKFNEIDDEMTFDFRASPPELFYSASCGGVQEIGDYLFFSHIITGGYFYSKKEKRILYVVPGINGNGLELQPLQQLKLVNLLQHFKNSGN